ncbi:MAG: hypothetical protein KKF62_02290 [Bacteroidetes bacterium]|nr:hypothetical protein [Bacteroidota bacterium]MBU1115220.1 hypothetical protein [Bacteroidota bacterium]MBU1797238.1 hypothetical protein [Bacteroidota bacterium]
MQCFFKKSAKVFFLILFFSTILFSQTVWEIESYNISLEDNTIKIFNDKKLITEITSFAFNFITPNEITVENTYKDSLVLKLSFDETDGINKDFPKEILLNISYHNNTFHFSAFHNSFKHITIQMKDLDEHYFGLLEKLYPHNAKSPDLRGETVDVEIYSAGYEDYAENYASAYSAFYMSSNGYGSFFDTFAKGRYHFSINGKTEIYHQTQKLDWYLFYGPTGDKIHSEYYSVIGKPKYVPIWACGPIFWRDENYGGKDQILDDIQKFTELEIPLTACFVDRPYSNGANDWSKMDFNDQFANPEIWIKTINEKYGMEFMTWIGSLTFGDTDFPGLLPNYKTYIDLTNPEALVELEKRLSENQYSVGVKGHKMDRADEAFPSTAIWHDKVGESETRNKYVYLLAKTIHEFLTKAVGKDQFNFARAAFHRTQPYLSAIWGGDVRTNWIGMASNQANAMRSSFMGFPVWGTDVGGYLGEGRIDELLYMRWLQWGTWNGMFDIKIDGSGGKGEDRPPWKYSEQLQNVFREACETRMKMLPYSYSLANTSYKNGVIMKPLTYMYPTDEKTYNIWDEYIFGNALLIAPVLTKLNSRDVYLPEGIWFDYNNLNKTYKGPTTIHQEVPVDIVPIFIKQNSIFVTGNIFQGNSKIWDGEIKGKEKISIHVFPGDINSHTNFTYVDLLDGDTEKNMLLSHTLNQISFNSPKLSTLSDVEIKLDFRPSEILSNGKSIEYSYDENLGIAKISFDKIERINIEVIY